MVCYHQIKYEKTRFNWYTALQQELGIGIDHSYDTYWQFIEERLQANRVVGDSNSWTPCVIPEVDSIFEVDRIIYLVRNGIQNVHSAYYHNARISRSDWLYTHFFRHYWELLDCPGGDWDEYTDWARWCLYWQINQTMPTWLADQLGDEKVLVLRFEDLLDDVDVLLNLLDQIDMGIKPARTELETLQETDINRKVQGERSPRVLWAKWTDEQREVFTRVCGTGMAHYGYEMPTEAVEPAVRHDATTDGHRVPQPTSQQPEWHKSARRLKRAVLALLRG
jgi:hypothetical protein